MAEADWNWSWLSSAQSCSTVAVLRKQSSRFARAVSTVRADCQTGCDYGAAIRRFSSSSKPRITLISREDVSSSLFLFKRNRPSAPMLKRMTQ
jgi:hypothetical protein